MYGYTLSIFSILWSVDNINSALGIILMILSILNILWTAGLKVYDAIKNKKYSDVSKILEDTTEQIKDLQEEDKK